MLVIMGGRIWINLINLLNLDLVDLGWGKWG